MDDEQRQRVELERRRLEVEQELQHEQQQAAQQAALQAALQAAQQAEIPLEQPTPLEPRSPESRLEDQNLPDSRVEVFRDDKRVEQEQQEIQRQAAEAAAIRQGTEDTNLRIQQTRIEQEQQEIQRQAAEAAAIRQGTEAARKGTEFHEMVKQNQPKGEYGNGWNLWRQDETVGGTRRPDEVWVNHAERRVVIVDHYTGGKRDVLTASGPESAAHNAKGLSYVNEPDIRQLIEEKGYKVDYAVGSRPAFYSPEHLH